ncbi:MAG: crotonase/enoyl-CoA hydratase family protein [Minwuia sp.]|nr:crotonase/enoyl-CoA hydratase family protein [Minwuia sp.]
MTYTSLALSIADHIAHVELDRPEKMNAMNRAFWQEMVDVFAEIGDRTDVRCVVLSGRGRHFTSGLDLQDFATLFQTDSKAEPARERHRLRRTVLEMQETFNVIERCQVPVLAAIHGACIGGGVDLITACDCRYASADAFIAIQEINIGMAADVGTLQRLPHLVPQGVAREMAFTGRRMPAQEAMQRGLVNEVLDDRDALMSRVMEIAAQIAARSPLAMAGVKEMLNYARDHSVSDSLNYVATWNAAMLIGDDVPTAIRAQMAKEEARFADLDAAANIVRRKGHRSGTL